MNASMWIGTEFHTRGTLAELAFLTDRDVKESDRWKVYLAGTDLPVLHEEDRPHMMKGGGVEALRRAYLHDRPRHDGGLD
jgi:hypothetical protein